MVLVSRVILFVASLFTSFEIAAQALPVDNGQEFQGWKEHHISDVELGKWLPLGRGRLSVQGNGQVLLAEEEGSAGFMAMRPTPMPEEFMLRYNVLALSPATVFITVLNARDKDSPELTIPKDYGGEMALLNNSQNYLLAFKNAPHGVNPYIAKNPGGVTSAAAEPDNMVAGLRYAVEIRKFNNEISIHVNGRQLVKMEDPKPLNDGNLILRVRGTAGFPGAFLVSNMRYYTRD